jgi:microsomal dipeptidase-like Zn-dependent dipeptidase
MRHSQRGVTFIGWLLLLTPIAILLYCGIRIFPMYMNFLNVSKALTQVAEQAKSASTISAQELKTSLEKNFDVQAIERPSPKDIEVRREGEHLTAVADYEDVAPIFANISLLLHFHKEVEVK